MLHAQLFGTVAQINYSQWHKNGPPLCDAMRSHKLVCTITFDVRLRFCWNLVCEFFMRMTNTLPNFDPIGALHQKLWCIQVYAIASHHIGGPFLCRWLYSKISYIPIMKVGQWELYMLMRIPVFSQYCTEIPWNTVVSGYFPHGNGDVCSSPGWWWERYTLIWRWG